MLLTLLVVDVVHEAKAKVAAAVRGVVPAVRHTGAPRGEVPAAASEDPEDLWIEVRVQFSLHGLLLRLTAWRCEVKHETDAGDPGVVPAIGRPRGAVSTGHDVVVVVVSAATERQFFEHYVAVMHPPHPETVCPEP